jgi:hypothetical protein
MVDSIDAKDVFASVNITNSIEKISSGESKLVTTFPEFYFSDITPCSLLKVNRLRGSMYQEIEFFIMTAVRTSVSAGYFQFSIKFEGLFPYSRMGNKMPTVQP